MAASQGALSQDALHTILTKLPFGLMVIDPEGALLLRNPAARAILENRFGWMGAGAPDLRSLPWEIQTGVEYLYEVSRQRAYQNSPPALTLTSPDLYLHLSLLFLDKEAEGKRSQKIYVVAVLKDNEPSLIRPWESRARLTPREEEVLQWLARGKSRKEISVILQVSEATVRTHLEHLYAKLGVTNRVEAIGVALQQQLAKGLLATVQLA